MGTRVSTQMIFDHAERSAKKSRAKEIKSAEKVSTQKRITRPSEDPQAWRIAKEMRDEVNSREVFGKNANVALSYLGATDGLIGRVQENIMRAYELSIAVYDKVGSEAMSQGALQEVEEIYDSVLQALNTAYGSRNLLGGYKTSGPVFDAQGNYLGDEGEIRVELEKGRHFVINTPGSEPVLGKGFRDGVNILEAMKKTINGLKEYDQDLVGEGIGALKRGVDQLSMSRATVGAKMAGIQNALSTNEEFTIDLLDLAAELDEIDVAQVFSDLARDQTALHATLTTSKKLLEEVPPDALFR